MKKKSLFYRIKERLTNKKLVVIILFSFSIVLGIASFMESIKKILINSNLFLKKGGDTTSFVLQPETLYINSSKTYYKYPDFNNGKQTNSKIEVPNLQFVIIRPTDSCSWHGEVNLDVNYSRQKYPNEYFYSGNPGWPFNAYYYNMAFGTINQSFIEKSNLVMDITLLNKSGSNHVISKIGIEILAATGREISKVKVECGPRTIKLNDVYRLEFPSPHHISLTINNEKRIFNTDSFSTLHLEEDLAWFSHLDEQEEIKDINGKVVDIKYFEGNYEWEKLPIWVYCNLRNPVLIEGKKPYRFLLQIDESDRIPTDALIKILVETDVGILKSREFYLFKE